MVQSRRRNMVAAAVFAATVGLVAAGAAFACTALASLSVTPQQGPAGTPITITGNGLAPNAAVSFRWGGASGTVLAQEFADDTGRAAASTTVPADAQAGAVVISVLQKNSAGEEVVRNNVIYTVGHAVVDQPTSQPAPVAQQPAAPVAQAPAPVAQPVPAAQTAPSSQAAAVASPALPVTRQPATRTAPQVAAPAPQPAPQPATPAAAPAPVAADAPVQTPQVRVAEPDTGGRAVAVDRSSRSTESESGTPGWLVPAMLLGVVLAVASCAVVAGGTPRRRARSGASVVGLPKDERPDSGPLHLDS